MNLRRTISFTLIIILPLLPQVAFASDGSHEFPGEGNLPYLLTAFAIVWAGFFGYVFYLHHQSNELRRDLEKLRLASIQKQSTKRR